MSSVETDDNRRSFSLSIRMHIYRQTNRYIDRSFLGYIRFSFSSVINSQKRTAKKKKG